MQLVTLACAGAACDPCVSVASTRSRRPKAWTAATSSLEGGRCEDSSSCHRRAQEDFR